MTLLHVPYHAPVQSAPASNLPVTSGLMFHFDLSDVATVNNGQGAAGGPIDTVAAQGGQH